MADRERGGPEAARAALEGSTVCVMGYGDHGGGAGMVDFLAAMGARIVLTEVRPRDAFSPEVLARLDEVVDVAHFGGHDDSHLDGADLLVRNPAVRFGHPLLAAARDRGIPVEMEMTLFFRWWPGRIVGVTGTKGKSTTTTLADAVLAAEGPTLKAGNLRVSAIKALLPGASPPDAVAIIELSSFQLEGLGESRRSPEVAIVTNLDEDHLDVYPTVEDYWAAKASIWLHQDADDWLVLPADDAATVGYVDASLAAAGGPGARRLLFADRRLDDGVEGAWTSAGRLHVRFDGQEHDVVGVDELQVRSAIAVLDLCAAVCAGLAEGSSVAGLREGCLAAREVEDRREVVVEAGGVTFVNDTTATAPRAATATVRSFAASPLAVICGGKAKRSAFDAFADELAASADHVVLLRHPNYDASGEIADLLDARGVGDRVHSVEALGDAVDLAVALLGAGGGVVLLSPAAASFGPFTNEFDRGARFRAYVTERWGSATPPGR
ncbi:MAG TPA: UDP-N-acetylmuramoyl-L-alanine--D-glutamate ligase [Iamia sp.]